MAKADPVLLEPVSYLEVTVPSEYQGDVMGDLNSRRGRVQGSQTAGDGEQTVSALVPTSEIMRYAIDLRSLTGGRGRFTATHDHYDVMPTHLVDKVKRETKDAD
jgi:elongation factor G